MEESITILGNAVGAHDFSILALFLKADVVVKTTMIMLFVASIWCWAIIFEKIIRLRKLNRLANKFEEAFWSGGPLDKLYDRVGNCPRDPMAAVFSAAMREWRRTISKKLTHSSKGRENLQARIDRVMQVTMVRETDRSEKYMTFLASTGATAPFIGLFGTVWGIMNSFQSIAMTRNTSLAVVAPGIAEALFATALGLVAAIPAVVAYNKLSRELDRYTARLDSFAGEFSAILSRQLEERR